jgi:hypothetical protein
MAPSKRSVTPLTGRWRIVEMDLWDRDAIDLVEPGFIEFAKDRTGQFGFIAVRGWMDCRTVERDGRIQPQSVVPRTLRVCSCHHECTHAPACDDDSSAGG